MSGRPAEFGRPGLKVTLAKVVQTTCRLPFAGADDAKVGGQSDEVCTPIIEAEFILSS